jgi:hypothetical protein
MSSGIKRTRALYIAVTMDLVNLFTGVHNQTREVLLDAKLSSMDAAVIQLAPAALLPKTPQQIVNEALGYGARQEAVSVAPVHQQQQEVKKPEIEKELTNLEHGDETESAVQDRDEEARAREQADKDAERAEMFGRHEKERTDLAAEQEHEQKETRESIGAMRKDLNERHAEDTPEQKKKSAAEFAAAAQSIFDQQATGHEQQRAEMDKRQMAELPLEQGREGPERDEQSRQAAERAAQEAAAKAKEAAEQQAHER